MGIGDWIRPFLDDQRVARLATVDEGGRPHVVPIVYAFDGERLFSPLDAKPKRIGPQQLKRVRNIQANPHVAVIIDEYNEDWRKLAWVQLWGQATLVESGPDYATGIALLEARYSQYAEMPLAGQPLIVIKVDHIASWRATDFRRET